MKTDVYQIITDRIVGLLEAGTVPWQKQWKGGHEMPRNLISGKEYRGINIFLLHAMSYQSPLWVTFKQAAELGGNVRKGEKSCPVVFWKWLEGRDSQSGEPKRIPLLRYYSAFNVAQCEGLEKHLPATVTDRVHNPIAEAESILAAMPKKPEIRHGQRQAYYSPKADYIGLPDPAAFNSDQDYYNVLFHELTHSTGHESRLNRKGVAGESVSFGSQTYSKEELVAEMGAAFLCGHCGIADHTIDNSAAYIATWLSRIKEEPKLVVQAAAAAQKASDYILGKQFTDGETTKTSNL